MVNKAGVANVIKPTEEILVETPSKWPYIIICVVGALFSGYAFRLWHFRRFGRPRIPKSSSSPLCVSVFLNGCVVDDSDDQFTVNESYLKLLLDLADRVRLYFVAKVPNSTVGDLLTEKLQQLGAFDKGFLKHHLLFCTNDESRLSIVGQIEPGIHIDVDASLVSKVVKKVPNVLVVPNKTKGTSDKDSGASKASTALSLGVNLVPSFEAAIEAIKPLVGKEIAS